MGRLRRYRRWVARALRWETLMVNDRQFVVRTVPHGEGLANLLLTHDWPKCAAFRLHDSGRLLFLAGDIEGSWDVIDLSTRRHVVTLRLRMMTNEKRLHAIITALSDHEIVDGHGYIERLRLQLPHEHARSCPFCGDL